MTDLVRVVAPHFVAAFEVQAGRVIAAAPILHRLRGLTEYEARLYIKRKNWKATIINRHLRKVREYNEAHPEKPVRLATGRPRSGNG